MTPETDLDLADPAFAADPYPALAALREAGPVHLHRPSGVLWAVSHPAANAVLRDRKLGRLWSDRAPEHEMAPFNLLHKHQMMENEPPEHGRLRKAVADVFTRRHVEALRPAVARIAGELLEAAGPEFDLIAEVAEPLPVRVIAELLGVPAADEPLLRPWSAAITAMYEAPHPDPVEQQKTHDAANAAAADFAAYVRGMVRQRRVAPRDDLVSRLAQAGVLSEDELVASAVLLLNAGHEASVNAFGNGAVGLLRRPAELRKLQDALADDDGEETGPVGVAVEELIRHDSPLQLFERTAKADTSVGGVDVPAGTKVAALLGAANRDPAVFADPDRLDVARDPNPHLGFGAGVHFCLGAPLARVELRTALGELLRTSPGLELAGDPALRPGFVLHGFRSVPVRR